MERSERVWRVSVDEGELTGVVVGRQGPAVGTAHGEVALLEGLQGVTEAGVVDTEPLTESGPGEGPVGVAQFVAYGFGEGWRLGVVAIEEEAGGLVVAAAEPQKHGIDGGSGAVLDGEAEALVGSTEEIASRVGPGVEVGAAPQGLAGVAARALGHVVDERDGEGVAAVELAEEAEQSGDVGGTVFVEAVESDEGIEEEECGPEGGEGGVECAPVGFEVEAQAGPGDDVEVEVGERELPVGTDLGDAVTELMRRVLGEIDDGGARGVDVEAAETGGTGGDGDGEIEPEPGFTGFGRSPDDADGVGAPEALDEPAGLGGPGVDGMDGQGRQALVHGHSTLRAAMTSPEETTEAFEAATSSRALRARRSTARRLPRLSSKMASRASASKGSEAAPAT